MRAESNATWTSGEPVSFGARGLVVAVAVWVVGFGLAKASGEKA